MNKKKIGKRIVERRKEKKLTQQDLADKLGITNRTIINWENGKYFPDYALLLPLCKELDISINELLTGEKNQEQKTNATIELILKYLDRKKNENLSEYLKVGKIFLIGGLLLTIIAVQIPITEFTAKTFLDTLVGIYPVIGLIFAFIGWNFINKKYCFKRRFILNSSFLVTGILFLVIADMISITRFNQIPRYYVDEITNKTSEGIIYLETLFYDAYSCYDWDFKIIPLSIKNYNESDGEYLKNKYCEIKDNNIEGDK